MIEIVDTSITAVACVAGIAILAFAMLSGWRSWLELKRLELSRGGAAPVIEDEQPATLIELASVKERLRRLEAIANGVEL